MKSTKKSLFLSTISLVLCFAMLLGTTWAWFTDEVQSGINQIKAGNLDVELYHAVGAVSENSDKVTADTKLFNIARWEPGVVAYENFMVKNVGTLALKYQLAMTVGDFNQTVDGGHTLKEVLKVAVVPGGFTGTTRAEAEALGGYTTLEQFSTRSNGALLPNTDGDIFGVVIYWQPTENDNLYNLNNSKLATAITGKFGNDVLGIELGIKLEATQLPSESDSFDNQYDAPADGTTKWSGSASAVAQSGKATTFTVDVAPATKQKTVVEFEAGALTDGSYKLDVETENNLFAATSVNGEAATIDLKLYDKSGTLTETFAEGKTATITTYVSKGMSGVGVSYTGTDGKAQPTFVSYDAETGKLVFKTNHFSEYEVKAASVAYIKATDTAYDTLALGIENAVDGQTVVALKNVKQSNSIVIDKDVKLDLNGKTITDENWAGVSPTKQGFFYVKSGAKLTVNDSVGTGAITTNNGTIYGAVCMTIGGDSQNNDTTKDAVLVVNGGTLSGYYYGVVTNGNRHNTDITINGGTLTGSNEADATSIYHPCQGKLTINGGTLKGYDGLAVKGGTINITGGKFIATGDWDAAEAAQGSGSNSVGAALYVEGNYGYDGKVNISGGEFIAQGTGGKAVYIGFNEDPKANVNITGGKFSSDVTEYCAEGFYSNKEGSNWVVSDQKVTSIVVDEEHKTVAEAVNAAIGAAEEGEVLTLPETTEEVKLPAIDKNITLKGQVDEEGKPATKVDAKTNNGGAGSIASIPNGATFENVVINFTESEVYAGFQHAGKITFKNCILNGFFMTYGDMEFIDCTFNAPGTGYSMWTYGKDATFTRCTFNGQGKWINVYCESNAVAYNITFNECKFVNKAETAKKSGINVKDTCGSTQLKYNVTINNCTYEGAAPAVKDTDTLKVFNSVVQLDDIGNGPSAITIIQDGVTLWPEA